MKELVDIEVKKIGIDAHHDDQAYDSKEFGLEAACPPSSPPERLRGCELERASYLLGAPSQVFMKPKMLLNCKLTDGKQSINVKAWTRVDDNNSKALTDITEDASPIELCKYLLDDEIENIHTYYIVTPEMENAPKTDENEGTVCLSKLEEILTKEQEMKGRVKKEEKKKAVIFNIGVSIYLKDLGEL